MTPVRKLMKATLRRGQGFFRPRRPRAYIIDHASEDVPNSDGLSHIAVKGGRAKAADRARARIGMCVTVFAVSYVSLAAKMWTASTDDALLIARPPATAAPTPASAPLFANLVAGAQPDDQSDDVQPADVAADNDGEHLAAVTNIIDERAMIYDRHGVSLAMNLPVETLEIEGWEVWRPAETATTLKALFPEIDVAEITEKFANRRYTEVKRDLTPAQREAVFALGLPGVRFTNGLRRYYPQGSLGAHVIGRTEPGKGGVIGLEKFIDRRPEAMGGKALYAALDARVQRVLEEELHTAIEVNKAQAGWGAVMDVHTGEVTALANWPDFDANAPADVPVDARRNRMVYDLYELGSAFKIITGAAVLEGGVGDEGHIYDATGYFQVADRKIKDFHGENRELTFSEVIQYSSNIGAARMAADLGVEKQKDFLRAVGLFDAMPNELGVNRRPQLPSKWGPVESATVSYGHGIAVTGLHLLSAFNAVINGGLYRDPTFVRVEPGRRPEGRRVFSAETSATMRRVLRRVIIDGTASKADVDGYYIIGKTATADKPSASGGYEKNARISTFVGAFPGTDPQYAILISLDNPQPVKGTHGYATAGWNAAPAFASVVSRLAPILQIMPQTEDAAILAFGADLMAEKEKKDAEKKERRKLRKQERTRMMAARARTAKRKPEGRRRPASTVMRARETEGTGAGAASSDPLADMIRRHATEGAYSGERP